MIDETTSNHRSNIDLGLLITRVGLGIIYIYYMDIQNYLVARSIGRKLAAPHQLLE